MKRVYYQSTDIKWNKETHDEWKKENIPAVELRNKVQKQVGVKVSNSMSFDNIFFVKTTDEENWNKPDWIITIDCMQYHYEGSFYNQFKANQKYKEGKKFTKDLNLMRKTLITFENFVLRKTGGKHHVSFREDGLYKTIESGLTFWDLKTFEVLEMMIPYHGEKEIAENVGTFKKVNRSRYEKE